MAKTESTNVSDIVKALRETDRIARPSISLSLCLAGIDHLALLVPLTPEAAEKVSRARFIDRRLVTAGETRNKEIAMTALLAVLDLIPELAEVSAKIREDIDPMKGAYLDKLQFGVSELAGHLLAESE
ncbi:hypothetical protein BH10CYA1_BH10CYA1_18270 [soil metagenome]